MARKTDYIFQRAGSANWYIKLRSPGQKRKEHSLGTSDKLRAESLAATMIGDHKKRLLDARPRIETGWRHQYEPGRKHVAPDGGEIIATDKELLYIGHNGAIIRTEPNGGTAFQLVGGPLTLRSVAEAFIEADFGDGRGERPKVLTKNGDDAIIETYLEHRRVRGYEWHPVACGGQEFGPFHNAHGGTTLWPHERKPRKRCHPPGRVEVYLKLELRDHRRSRCPLLGNCGH